MLEAAVEKVTDQALLAKVAVADVDWNVRATAFHKLTNQAALAKVAIEGKTGFPHAAVEKVTDQALLVRVAVEASDSDVRRIAVEKLTDDDALVKVAIESEHSNAGFAAIKKLTNQAALAKVAVEGRGVRWYAVGKLTDQALLAKIATEDKDPFVRADAIAVMDEWNPATKRLAGDLSRLTTDAGESIARIRLAIQEPRIRIRFPRIVFAPRVVLETQSYSWGDKGGDKGKDTVYFVLSQAGKTLAKKDWGYGFFPMFVSDLGFEYAKVHGGDLLTELLHNAVVTQGDLAELSSSEIPELRQASVGILTDQAALAKAAVNDQDIDIRKLATGKLTNQTVLAKIAVEDKNRDVRRAAVGQLTDQAALARVAVGDKDVNVRGDVWGKLRDQAALAKVAVEAEDADVRRHAFGELTDQAALAKVAVEAEDSDVRQAASEKVTDQALRAKIAEGQRRRLRRNMFYLVALLILLTVLVLPLLRKFRSR